MKNTTKYHQIDSLSLKVSRLLGAILLLFIAYQSSAQVYAENGIRFAQSRFGGTARFQGIAGANTALGGDISSGLSNPAGLGFNRKNEFSFTPTGSVSLTNSDYYVYYPSIDGDIVTEDSDSRFALAFDHFGLTIASQPLDSGAFKGGAFSITYSRTNDFNERYSYGGISPDHSIVDHLSFETQGIPSDILADETENGIFYGIAALGYANYLMNPVSGFSDAYGTVGFEPDGYQQSETVTTRGGQRSWNFSYGANFNDRIYVGASLGIESVRYIQEKNFKEVAINPVFELESNELTETLTIKGTGINVKAGVIFRPINILRLGLTITSPTIYQIEDTFEGTLKTKFNTSTIVSYYTDTKNTPDDPTDDEYYDETIQLPSTSFESSLTDYDGEEGEYSTYTLYTPFRAEVGAALFLGKAGFISADVEYVNYGGTRVRNEELPEVFERENNFIKDNINSAININLGAELRFFKTVYARGGLAYFGDPTNRIGDIESARVNASLGAGYRNAKFYVDLTLTGTALRNITAIPYNAEYVSYDEDGNEIPPRYLNSYTDVGLQKIRGLVSVGFFF